MFTFFIQMCQIESQSRVLKEKRKGQLAKRTSKKQKKDNAGRMNSCKPREANRNQSPKKHV